MLEIMSLEQVISRVKRLAADKLASHVNADEFIEIGDADGFKIYVTAGKTIDNSPHPLHENPRDAFMMLLEGEIEFILENGERETVKSGKVSFCQSI